MLIRPATPLLLCLCGFFAACHTATAPQPPASAAADDPVRLVVHIATDAGELLLELDREHAPLTCANFTRLADAGFYNGLAFHRVIPGFMAQGGCPNSRLNATGTPGTGGPGYTFADEPSALALHHDAAGILSMANRGPNTNGSQFFITYAPQPHLDGHHAVFGRLVGGMDTLQRLHNGSRILSVRVAVD